MLDFNSAIAAYVRDEAFTCPSQRNVGPLAPE